MGPEKGQDRTSSRQLAAYSYLRPLVSGARVLELGCGDGTGTALLSTLGARAVIGTDRDVGRIDRARRTYGRAGVTFIAGGSVSALQSAGPFEIILIPQAAGFLGPDGPVTVAVARKLLSPGGRLVCIAPSADAILAPGAQAGVAGAVGYFDLVDGLSPYFEKVRMFGLTPFHAFGLAEFDEAAAGLRLESALVDDTSVRPTHYVAVAGPEGSLDLGYALVQVSPEGMLEATGMQVEPAPVAPGAAPRRTAAATSDPVEVADLRRRLADLQGQADGVLRVSRAQAEELEELRARLRRGAEARAELDEEVSRLRRGLTAADESVLSLTRRTTEEMTALAQQLTAGLRAGSGRDAGADAKATAALTAQVRQQDVELAARESALAERDERIAALEAEKQDIQWRLDAADAKVEQAAKLAVEHRQRPEVPLAAPPAAELATRDLADRLAAGQRALEQFRLAATAHRDEIRRVRAALDEQSTLVAELEDARTSSEARATAAEAESKRLRLVVSETEDSDRARRSKLAELEGKLLRLQRQSEDASRRAPASNDALHAAESQVVTLQAQLQALQQQLDHDRQQGEAAQQRWGDAVGRIVGLEQENAQYQERVRDQERQSDRLHERLGRLESQEDVIQLATALEEVARLRAALEHSEEQLWEVKAELSVLRERGGSPGRPVPVVPGRDSEGIYQAMLINIFKEMAALEAGLRTEVAHLAQVERALADCTASLSPTAGAEGAPSDLEP